MPRTPAADLTVYADKKPNEHHELLASWITEKTGAKVDLKSVYLTITLYSRFQASPENKAFNKERKAKREAALKARAEKKTVAAKPVKKTSAPKPAAKKTVAKAPAKKAAATKKTAVKKPATKPTETPF